MGVIYLLCIYLKLNYGVSRTVNRISKFKRPPSIYATAVLPWGISP